MRIIVSAPKDARALRRRRSLFRTLTILARSRLARQDVAVEVVAGAAGAVVDSGVVAGAVVVVEAVVDSEVVAVVVAVGAAEEAAGAVGA